MEEAKNKEFDRRIEQMMNESTTPPPYGMWNRISAEIGNTPVVTPVPGPAGSYSFMALAVGIGMIASSLVTAYILNNRSEVVKTPAPIEVTVRQPASNFVSTVQPDPIVENNTQVSESKPVRSSRAFAYPKAVAIPARESVILASTLEASEISSVNGLREYGQSYVPKKLTARRLIIDEDEAMADKKVKFRPKAKKTFTYGRIIRRK